MSITAGCCYILKVSDGYGSPVIGILTTDLGEHLPVYSRSVKDQAEIAMLHKIPVYLNIVPQYDAEKRYVKAIHLLRAEDQERPCVSCGERSILFHADTIPDFYECLTCSFRAYLGRVPKVPA